MLKHIVVLPVIIILFFSGCSDSSMFLETGSNDSVSLKTVQDGTLLSSSDTLNFSISYGEGYENDTTLADSMAVSITNEQGQVVVQKSFDLESVENREEFSLDLPSLQEGLYTVRLEYFDGDGLIAKKETSFFYWNTDFSVAQIEVTPPVVYPGSSAIFAATINRDGNMDPYLRWSADGDVIAEGYYSENFNVLTWQSPYTEYGVYPVQVEVFPTGPVGSGSFLFDSTVQAQSTIMVTREISPGKNELAPKGSYNTLLHFRGNLRDDGYRSGDLDYQTSLVKVFGDVPLAFDDGILGYRLENGNSLYINDLTIPVENGVVMPSSVTFRLQTAERQKSKVLFSASSGDGRFNLNVSTDDDGVFQAQFSNQSGRSKVISSGFGLENNVPSVFNLSLSPEGANLRIHWFLNGRLINSGLVDVDFGKISSVGTARLGGEDGFDGIIDEFGVYFRDEKGRSSIDSRIFASAMSSEYGENLTYAESFDGSFLSDQLKVTGNVYLRLGSLYMDPGSTVTFPFLPFSNEMLKVEILAAPGSSSEYGQFHFDLANSGSRLVTLTNAGELTVVGKSAGFVPFDETDGVILSFSHDNQKLAVTIEDNLYDLSVGVSNLNSFTGLSFKAEHPVRMKLPLVIHNVLARRITEDLSGAFELLD